MKIQTLPQHCNNVILSLRLRRCVECCWKVNVWSLKLVITTLYSTLSNYVKGTLSTYHSMTLQEPLEPCKRCPNIGTTSFFRCGNVVIVECCRKVNVWSLKQVITTLYPTLSNALWETPLNNLAGQPYQVGKTR